MSALTITAPMPLRYMPPPSLLDCDGARRDRPRVVERIAAVLGWSHGHNNPPAGEAAVRPAALPAPATSSRVAGATHDRLSALATAIIEALTEGRCMAEDGELEPPDADTWNAACRALTAFLAGPFAEALDVPLISPMRRGGLSAEWHERDMNIELRFRGPRDVYAVIEDARGAIGDFRGSDPHLERAAEAIAELASRSD
jgi:hypothetical protein